MGSMCCVKSPWFLKDPRQKNYFPTQENTGWFCLRGSRLHTAQALGSFWGLPVAALLEASEMWKHVLQNWRVKTAGR